MYNDLLLNRIVAQNENDEQIQDLINEIEELDNLLSPEAQELIRGLRPHIVTDDVYEDIDELCQNASKPAFLDNRLLTVLGIPRCAK